MRRYRSLQIGVAMLVVLATTLVTASPAAALCGDCAVVLDEETCVSPPETYAFCHYYYDFELFVIAGKIIRVRVQRCEGYQPCAV